MSAVIGRVARSLATVATVGVLSFAMPISASAFVPAPVVAPIIATLAAGGGEGVAATAAGAVCATGIGCAVLGVAAVGIGLYATQDTWLPWVHNLFGQGPATATQSQCAEIHWSVPPSSTPGMTFTIGAWATTPNLGCNITGLISRTWTLPDGSRTSQNGMDWNTDSYPSPATQPGSNNPERFRSFDSPAGWTLVGVDIEFWKAQEPTTVHGTLKWGEAVAAFDPNQANVQARVSCENPDGSMYEVVGTELVDGLIRMPSCVGALGSMQGAHGKCVTLLGSAPGGVLAEQSSTCAAAQALRQEYPGCVGPGVAACKYVVRVDGLPCTVGASACLDWARSAREDPSRVTCRWGTYTVALAGCGILERAYEPRVAPLAPLTATQSNTDGLPETYTAPGPSGQPQSQNVPGPGPGPAPAPQPQPLPNQTPGTIGSPNSPVTQQERECWPSGWGLFNPMSWVMQPVKCAMSWAFVPRAAVVNQLSTSVRADLGSAGIAPLASGVGGNLALLGGGSGCLGPAVSFEAVGIVKPLHPFSACEAPISTLATISRAVSTVAIVCIGGFGAMRAVGSGFGFNVTMGRGKGEGV